jgi:hypothetical protein
MSLSKEKKNHINFLTNFVWFVYIILREEIWSGGLIKIRN